MNLTLDKIKRKDGTTSYQLSVFEGKDKLASGGGDTPRDAALWLVRCANRVVEKIETLVVDAGWLTEEEIESDLAAVEAQLATEETTP